MTPPREADRPLDPSGRPLPPHVTMGLLNYVTAHSLDEDYELVARHRQARGAAEPDGAPGRGLRRHALAVVGLLLFGSMVGIAAVQASRSEPVAQQSQDSLVQQVRDLRADVADARAVAAGLRNELDAARNDALQASAQGRELSARLDRLSDAAGGTALTGPGLRVVVDDGPADAEEPQVVLDTDLQKLVNGLWTSGAEAVAVNGQRITSLSAIRIAGDAITVNYRSLSRPYVVTALGDPGDLAARFVESEGGTWWLNLKSIYDLEFTMTTEEELTVPAAPEISLRHARLLEDAS